MAEFHGQHEGRRERIDQTRRWLSASHQTDFGETIVEDLDDYNPDMAIVLSTVEQIRIAVQGKQRVHLGEKHRPTLEMILSMLTPDEQKYVQCDLDNIVPPPDGLVVGEEPRHDQPQAAAAPTRDFIRRRSPDKPLRHDRPNYLSVENGRLRPLE